jgi:starch synthase (maltosyl-transferring)
VGRNAPDHPLLGGAGRQNVPGRQPAYQAHGLLEWLIGEVRADHPEVIFLSEAFTRPKVMKALAKAGFTQSYTYFTWRNFKQELREYGEELTQTPTREFMRGNFFTNTHDILPQILQEGGRPAFQFRVVLAATMSSVYGIYSGFELCENTPVPGKEEYLNSEKYEYKVWDWDRPGNISDYIARLNTIRRDHPALQEYYNLRFVETSDDQVLAYYKATPDHRDIVLVVVNLDPFHAHDTRLTLPLDALGMERTAQIRAEELFGNEIYMWTGPEQVLRLDPGSNPAAIFSLSLWQHREFVETDLA